MTTGPPLPWLELDSESMVSAAAGLGEQVAAALSDPVPLPPSLLTKAPPRSVVVGGMGGSAIAAEVLAAYAATRSSVPVVLANGGPAPRFLERQSVVFVVSFSGETEETLALASAALSSPATVVAVTRGGSLARLVADGGGVVMALDPARMVSLPRSGIGASIATLLLAVERLGLLDGAAADLSAVCAQLALRRSSLSAGGGTAAEVARQIGRTIPVFHGAGGLGAVAARRWKTQVNENAKAPAYFGVQTEVCHNELCGFGQHGDVTRQVLSLVNLRTGVEDARVARCFELFSDLSSEALARVIDVEAKGAGELARFFDLVMIGDFVSLHLAQREGVDPGPLPAAADLAQRLRPERRG